MIDCSLYSTQLFSCKYFFQGHNFFCLYSSVTVVLGLSSETLLIYFTPFVSNLKVSVFHVVAASYSWSSVLDVPNYLASGGLSTLICHPCLTPIWCAVMYIYHDLSTIIFFCMQLLHCRAIIEQSVPSIIQLCINKQYNG